MVAQQPTQRHRQNAWNRKNCVCIRLKYVTGKKYLPKMKNRQKAKQTKTADSVCMLYLFEHEDKPSIQLGLLLKGSESEFHGIDYGLHTVSFS
jgi:hypothetical protein